MEKYLLHSQTPPMTLSAPLKINLCLRVTGRNADGYHSLCMLNAISYSIDDTITLRVDKADNAKLQVVWTGSEEHKPAKIALADDESNLAVRAFRFAASYFGLENGYTLEIEKSIPIGAGLGGGSSDAASVLRAVFELLQSSRKSDIDFASFSDSALSLGSDVPFFLSGFKAALVLGVGSNIQPVNLKLSQYRIYLIVPNYGISTPEVYAAYRKLVPNVPAAKVKPEFESPAYWERLSSLELLDHFENDLELAAIEVEPRQGLLLAKCRELLEGQVVQTGSGSAVLWIVERNTENTESPEQLLSELAASIGSIRILCKELML